MVQASIVIRTRDEAASIAQLLDVLARQTTEHETIVVDSGSADETVGLARAGGVDRVVELAADDFSFGRALNLGASHANAPVIVALSAHAFPPDDGWLGRVVACFDDPLVACACGESVDADFSPLAAPVRQDAALARANPYWGYSNGAGAVRASLWRERPFREDMPGTEDREWAWWAMSERGSVCVLDPALVVYHDHTHDGLRSCFRRYEREHRGYAMFLDLAPYGARDALREWSSDRGGHRSVARARLDPRRAARLAGKWWGRRGA